MMRREEERQRQKREKRRDRGCLRKAFENLSAVASVPSSDPLSSMPVLGQRLLNLVALKSVRFQNQVRDLCVGVSEKDTHIN